MGKQYLNGVLYGSPTVVADEIIDYTTSLYNGSTSSWESIISYTATSKCIAYLRYTGNNGTNMYPILNGGNALFNLGILKTNGYYTCSIILQPGDTIASRYQADEDRYGTPYFHMKIYAIKANKSENYSTTERIIGTWIDGKPLYEITKVFAFSDLTQLTSQKYYTPSYGLTNATIRDLDAIAYSTGYSTTRLGCINYFDDNDTSRYWTLQQRYGGILLMFNGASVDQSLIGITQIIATIRYTKTTD